MKKNIIDTHSKVLSFVAKALHYGYYYPYFYLLFVVLVGFIILLSRISNVEKKELLDIKFRKDSAYNSLIKNNFLSTLLIVLCSVGVLLYYDLHASKPLEIDEPIIVNPDKDGNFVFDVQMLRDNKLHRYAYISDEGKVIRFFMINKYEDRNSPVAVFDSCMICGDMGYIKKDGELICISCNVRIFLPSVGKFGGCNPIPLPYTYDDKNLIIKFDDVMAGANYFTEVREKEVTDPVSKKKLINLKAPYNYVYGDKTFYFESKENREEFKRNPEKYAGKLKEAYFRVQGFQGGKDDN